MPKVIGVKIESGAFEGRALSVSSPRRSSVAIVLTAVAACLTGTGCYTPYVVSVAWGQLSVLAQARPVEQVLAEDSLSPEEVQKLEYLLEVREFAVGTIGLKAGDSFTTFLDTSHWGNAYNISAAEKDSLTPVTWTLPFVGELPYLGFFDENQAESFRQQLKDTGYDTLMYEVDAYSTLGVFADPVRRSMLRRDEIDLADVVIHELTHNTVWRLGDVEFNESLATFVARTGAVAFLEQYFGPETDRVRLAAQRFADEDRFNAFLAGLYADLAAFYAGDLTRDEKIEQRGLVFQEGRDRFTAEELPNFNHPELYEWAGDLPANNALVLAYRRYNLDLDLFAAVHDATGGDFRASLSMFSEAAAQGDAKAFLRAWLAEQASP